MSPASIPAPSPVLLHQLLCSSGPSAAAAFPAVGLASAPLATLESAVQSLLHGATGPEGLALVFLYSFLCAVLLPLPGELVLAVPLRLGWSPEGELAAVIAVASAAKAVGALATLAVARGAVTAGPVARFLEAVPRPSPPRSLSSAPSGAGGGGGSGLSGRLAGVANRYGYVGLAGALSVPFAPDTAILYAFSVVDVRRPSFAAAAFVGTTLRLAIVAGAASALLALF